MVTKKAPNPNPVALLTLAAFKAEHSTLMFVIVPPNMDLRESSVAVHSSVVAVTLSGTHMVVSDVMSNFPEIMPKVMSPVMVMV